MITAYLPAIMAFLHHVAAFTLVSALAIEVALLKPPFTLWQARRVQITDIIFGTAAGVLLVVGLLRVVYFEKGRAQARDRAAALRRAVAPRTDVPHARAHRDPRDPVLCTLHGPRVRLLRAPVSAGQRHHRPATGPRVSGRLPAVPINAPVTRCAEA